MQFCLYQKIYVLYSSASLACKIWSCSGGVCLPIDLTGLGSSNCLDSNDFICHVCENAPVGAYGTLGEGVMDTDTAIASTSLVNKK